MLVNTGGKQLVRARGQNKHQASRHSLEEKLLIVFVN